MRKGCQCCQVILFIFIKKKRIEIFYLFAFIYFFFSEKEMLDMEREKMDKTFKKLKICRMEREPKLERMKDHISELETGAKTVNMDNEVMIRDLSEKIENLE